MIWTTRQRSEFAGLAAIVAGSGDPVLLIHGVGLRARHGTPRLKRCLRGIM